MIRDAARYLWISVFLGLSLIPATAQTVELNHRFGTTRIEGVPQRVVSISYIGHDFLLALGVTPIALRHWYGDHPYGVWPWAQDALGDATPTVLYGAIDIEKIALLQPDLIVGQWSGMTATEYRLLSRIAPTIPPAAGETDYSSSWRLMLTRLGSALGRAERAAAIIERIDGRLAAVRAANPHWRERTAVMVWPPRLGAHTSQDLRGRFLADLGFEAPAAIDASKSNNGFYVEVPQENLTLIDTDLLVWLHAADVDRVLQGFPLRRTMRAYREGRGVYADYVLTAALSHSSPLSLDYVLDALLPMIEAALDGDPATPVQSAVDAGFAPRQ